MHPVTKSRIARRRAASLLLAAVIAACQPETQQNGSVACVGILGAGEPAYRIRFELAPNRRMFVDAVVNGRGPFRFIYDSGADGIGRADTRLVEALGLELSGTTEHTDGVNTDSIDVVRLESLAVGGIVREDVEVFSRSYNRPDAEHPFDGIIGGAFFGRGVLVIDYPGRAFVYLPQAQLDPSQASVSHYEQPYEIPIAIGDLELLANIDTGSTLSMHIPHSIYEQLDADPLEFAGQGRRANTTFDLYRTTLHEPVRVGSAMAYGVEARVSELARHVNVGVGLLENFVVALDSGTERIAVCSP